MDVSPETLHAARSHLPAWVGWVGPTAWIAIVFVSAHLGTWVALLPSVRVIRRTAPVHWTDLARIAWPFHQAARACALLAPVLGVIPGAALFGPLVSFPLRLYVFLGCASALAGSLLAAAAATRRVSKRKPSWRILLRTWVAMWLLFRPVLLLLLLTALAMPLEWGAFALCLLAGAMLLFTWYVHGGCAWLLLRLGLVEPAPEWLRRLAKSRAETIGTRAPSVLVLDALVANAVVLLLPRQLLVMRPLLELLERDELDAVIAHEMGHLQEPRWLAWMRLLPAYLCLGFAAMIPATLAFGPVPVLVLLLVLVVAAVLVLRVARHMEDRADHVARDRQATEGAFARALEKMYAFNDTPAVVPGTGSPHAHLYDRLLAAGVQPSYPRPAAPSRWRAAACVALGALVFLVPGVLLGFTQAEVYRSPGKPGRNPLLEIVLSGSAPRVLLSIARLRHEQGDGQQADDLARLAREASPDDEVVRAEYLSLCVEQNRDVEARRELEEFSPDLVFDPWRLAWLATIHEDYGRRVPARQCLERARRLADEYGARSAVEAHLQELRAQGWFRSIEPAPPAR